MELAAQTDQKKLAWWFIAGFVAVAAIAVAYRVPRLGERTFHGDEAVQAFKAGQELYEDGEYEYNPEEYHGPTLYYLTVPALWLSGIKHFADSTEVHYRIVPVLFGLGTVLCLWWARDGLGRRATLIAGLLTALSPAMVYYSRYYIQESLLVFFTFATLVTGWRYTRRRNVVWAALCGASLGMMHSSKETCVISYFGVAVAFMLTPLWARLHDEEHPLNRVFRRGESEDLRPRLARQIVAFVAAGALVSMLMFSSFFTNLQGIIDSVMSYTVYVQRAVEAGIHHHPATYYLHLLLYTHRAAGPVWSEGLIVGLALVGAVSALMRHDRDNKPGNVHFLRFVTVYTITTTIVYSSIKYKTPWSILCSLHGMILLAGAGAVVLLRIMPCWPKKAGTLRYAPKVFAGLVLAALAIQLGWQSYLANFDYYDDPRNPYVYAHAVSGVRDLGERADAIAQYAPEGHGMLIRVITPGLNYWPLPWYLRRFPNVGYWQEVPENCDAPMIITTAKLAPEVYARLKDEYQSENYGLRPGIRLVAFIRRDLWDAFMAPRM
ncbi:MAG TPA: TIGR03663 family protein [Candidatus Hydrogenedentes bacterium]|nr:TIGR03663 family protein [Candidatus Hydrogenedentota bacterium]HQM48222.1 TIGR03663 family protein [Candidatus Hydrogenedentota bacterium]